MRKLRRYASRSMLAAGVRYRFANGLRAAMSVWGTLLVACAIAAGLKATPPFLAWGHAWMAAPFPRRLLIDAGVALVLGFVARSAFATWVGAWGEEQLVVLPLSRGQRFAIDALSVAVYLVPPGLVMVGSCRSLEPVVAIVVACFVGAGGARSVKPRPSSAASRHLLPVGEGLVGMEWRWVWRVGRDRVLFAVVGATLVAAASFFAIHNNDVVSAFAVLRIQCAFLAFASGVLASAIVGARQAARPYRVTESIVPIASSERINAMLITSLPLMLAPLVAIALLRVSIGALLYGAAVFAALLLIGEAHSDAVVVPLAIVAAIGGALDGRVALVLVIALLPFAWRAAVITDASRDLRVTRTEAAA